MSRHYSEDLRQRTALPVSLAALEYFRLNSIEQVFAKQKAPLRKAAADVRSALAKPGHGA